MEANYGPTPRTMNVSDAKVISQLGEPRNPKTIYKRLGGRPSYGMILHILDRLIVNGYATKTKMGVQQRYSLTPTHHDRLLSEALLVLAIDAKDQMEGRTLS